MSVIDDLKPTRKPGVMNLLAEAGFDVSDWKNVKGQPPSRNPKYCYNWSFEQPGEAVALCLWHRSLKRLEGKVAFHRKPTSSRRKVPGSNPRNTRDRGFGARLELAYRQQLPVKVIVIDGKEVDPAIPKSKASVRGRLLDETTWAVTKYNYETGECWLIRGETPPVPAVDPPDLEASWFEGKGKRAFVYHRHREAKARREKIREAISKNGGKLVCEVPDCGFDFKARYGPLGEGYAQVHHLLPLSASPSDGRRVEMKNLAVVCANCHVMIHIGGECRPLEGLIREPAV